MGAFFQYGFSVTAIKEKKLRLEYRLFTPA